jgi:hypothetical protein
MTAHAIARAMERYGVALDEKALAHIRYEIAKGRSVLLGRKRNGQELRLVTYAGTALKILWHPTHEAIITVMPRTLSRLKRGKCYKGRPSRSDL